jgi:Holliday junction resolvase RusA-like endonuclease
VTDLQRLEFWVPGQPQTAGSKRGFVNPKTGGVIITESAKGDAKTRKKTWRADLRASAADALERAGAELVAEAPLYVRFVFVRKRPSTHLGTGKNAGVVKDWAVNLRPTQRPDALKLARAAEDALTTVLWHDDAQIVSERLDKAYGDQVTGNPYAEGLLVVMQEVGEYAGPRLTLERAV